ncbi:MAG: hypothetical protein E7582_06975 [Ruminococcaceae bacterium]|nr:hypothetical protein [Oscillospiraceae bacterium]
MTFYIYAITATSVPACIGYFSDNRFYGICFEYFLGFMGIGNSAEVDKIIGAFRHGFTSPFN